MYADRVEQRGRGNKHRATLLLSQLSSAEVERTHKGQWLHLQGADGTEITQQGLEAAPAEAARALIVQQAAAIGNALPSSDAAAAESAPAQPQAIDVPEQIRKLAELHAQGILTDDEFQTKKRELLDRL